MDLTSLETLRAKLGLANASKPALVGLTALFVMVAVFAGRFIIDTATATEITIEHDDVSAQSSEISASSDAGSSSASSSSNFAEQPATIFVHVSGAVAAPGLVELAEGSRVADAVKAAGGILEEGAADSVNLARKLNDGEQLHVMTKDEAKAAGGIVQSAASGQDGSSTQVSGHVNINTASQGELESLPGIGHSTAAKILADREANGPYASTDDLMRVAGIGEKKYASIADLICV